MKIQSPLSDDGTSLIWFSRHRMWPAVFNSHPYWGKQVNKFATGMLQSFINKSKATRTERLVLYDKISTSSFLIGISKLNRLRSIHKDQRDSWRKSNNSLKSDELKYYATTDPELQGICSFISVDLSVSDQTFVKAFTSNAYTRLTPDLEVSIK